jgi:hypothetical protein
MVFPPSHTSLLPWGEIFYDFPLRFAPFPPLIGTLNRLIQTGSENQSCVRILRWLMTDILGVQHFMSSSLRFRHRYDFCDGFSLNQTVSKSVCTLCKTAHHLLSS